MNSFFSLSNGLVNPIHDLLLLIIIFLVVEFPFSFFVVPSPLLKFSILSFISLNMLNTVILKSLFDNSTAGAPVGIYPLSVVFVGLCPFMWQITIYCVLNSYI